MDQFLASVEPDINCNLTRRTFLTTGAAAGIGVLVVSQNACDKPDVDFYVATITGALEKLKPLLPNQATLLTRAISIAREVNKAYQDGKFDSAKALANNLLTAINDVVQAAGANLSTRVKSVLLMVDIALSALAVLIQRSLPQSTAERAMSPVDDKIEQLASPKRIDAIYEASRKG